MLVEYLPSVIAGTSPSVEIIVTDNHSSDGTADMLRERFPTVRLIELERNFGFAAGYNQALRQVVADYYILLNQDVEVTPGWIEPLVALMEGNSRIAACQPKIKDLRNKNLFEYAGASGGFLDSLAYPFCRGRVFESIEEDTGQYDAPIDCAWSSGAAMIVRSDLYHAFGGLDESFQAHMEEIDLCWRFRSAGYRIACCPQSVVYHLGAASLARSNPRKTFLNFRNNFIMLIKNERGVSLIYKIPLRWVLDVVAGLRFLMTGRVRHFWQVIRAHGHVILRFPRWWASHSHVKRLVKQRRIHSVNRAGVLRGLLVWKYFVGGRKHFRDLKASQEFLINHAE
jgi:GT2 family glycosyltransferase